MYTYQWDAETGGYTLNTTPMLFSKEPRPVYYKELDILGFDKALGWKYPKDDSSPLMWAELNCYWYRGRKVAQTKGGSLYTAPEIIGLEQPEPDGLDLRFVDIEAMVAKNKTIMDALANETIKKIYNTWKDYKAKVDIFYVAFSGGKDSVALLDMVQRALPHNEFKVIFGDTGMEFSDTYEVVRKIQAWCVRAEIDFHVAKSQLDTERTWKTFGPPSSTIRWCCSVHKTTPQILLIRKLCRKTNSVGMAFTGIRGDESDSRSDYEEINLGEKHKGQYSFHPLLDWNSAELFLYIFTNHLVINDTYKKGNSRAGCLVCPMSGERHEYMKRQSYGEQIDRFVTKIVETSGKTNFTKEQMDDFLDAGHWKSRRSGQELNFGLDCFTCIRNDDVVSFSIPSLPSSWKEWVKTIGKLLQIDSCHYVIEYANKRHDIGVSAQGNGTTLTLSNCTSSKEDTLFVSLFKGVIKKTFYCIQCGVCEAECKRGCIAMQDGVTISNSCIHCHQCHGILGNCLRYNSVRNKNGNEKQMKNIDRYFTFGFTSAWLKSFVELGCDFWEKDSSCVNKKQESFVAFLKDASLVREDSTKKGKFTKWAPSNLINVIAKIGAEQPVSWGIILSNLVYTPQFNWYHQNIKQGQSYSPDHIKIMLQDAMENDNKGLKKRNFVSALKVILLDTPIGNELGFGICDYERRINAGGVETRTLKSITRSTWANPNPLVILYSLYKFAEAGSGGYHQFSLSELMRSTDRDGISPSHIFGLSRISMETLVKGLAANHPDFISVAFTHDLDNIVLRNDKTSQDILELF